jgi:long-chain fatty acid transport protein
VAGTKSDPATVYINPAAIGDIGKFSASAGVNYYNFSAERTGSNGTSDKMKTGNIPIPNFATVGSVADGKIGWGLAVNSPYGLSTEWSDTSNVRYVATKSTIKMLDITPAVSYRPSEKMAFGIGADYYSTLDASLERKVPVDVVNFLLGFPTSGSPDANSKLSGDGSQWGYHTGILYNPNSNNSFGITYHSEVKTRVVGELEVTGLSGASAVAFGGTSFKTAAYTDLFYPQNVQFGYKYSQGDKWELGTNFAWYDWSANQQLAIHLPNANATQKALAETAIPLKWKDVWSFTVGGMYRFNDNWKLNGGAYYLPSVYPEETFSPAVPDMNKIGLSVGPSYTKGAWSIDTVYSPLFYKTTTINNTVGQSSTGLASADVSGEYKAMIHIIGLNLKYKY